MVNGAPDRKIGIVTFNGEVTLIGDGTHVAQTLAGDKLYDFDFLLQNGASEGAKRLQQPVKATKDKLI